jgi:outer membrane immunogenic protein
VWKVLSVTSINYIERLRMKRGLLGVSVAIALFAGSAMAQSAFEGFYGQVGTGYESNSIAGGSPNFTGAGCTAATCNGSGTGSSTKGSAPLIVGLGYTFVATPQFTVGLGVDYSTLSQTTSTVSSVVGQPPSSYYNYKISNRYDVFVAPGYAIDKDKLAYFKIGYSNEGVQGLGVVNCPTNCNSGTVNTSGYVLGLGYKQIINGGLYGFGEANYYSYGKPNISVANAGGSTGYTLNTNPGTVSAYQFLVGVGYKF